MQRGVEGRAFREYVRSVEVLARPKHARAAVAQPDLHLAAEDEHPLRFGRAMPLAAKADRAVPQLVAGGGEHLREHRLRIAFGQRDGFLFEFRSSIAVGEQHYSGEIQADPLAGGLAFLKAKSPRPRSPLPPFSGVA